MNQNRADLDNQKLTTKTIEETVREYPFDSNATIFFKPSESFLSENSYLEPPKDLAEQLQNISATERLCKKGRNLIIFLYTHRSLGKAIMFSDDTFSEAEKLEIHTKTLKIMQTSIDKIMELIAFKNELLNHFKLLLAKVPSKQDKSPNFIPKCSYITIVDLLDQMLKISSLIELRVSLKNDFALYKRSANQAQTNVEDIKALQKDITTIGMFLNNPTFPRNGFLSEIKLALQKLENFPSKIDTIVFSLIEMIEINGSSRRANLPIFTPEKLGKFYRALLLLLFLGEPIENSFISPKKFSMIKNRGYLCRESLRKALKQFPIVPLFGEMVISVERVLRMMAVEEEINFSEWITASNSKISEKQFINMVSTTLNEFFTYQKKLALAIKAKNSNFVEEKKLTQRKGGERPANVSLLFETLSKLFDWTTNLRMAVTLRYGNPISDEDFALLIKSKRIKESLKGFGEYLKALTFNFSQNELFGTFKIIYCIKETEKLLKLYFTKFEKEIRAYFAKEFLDFNQSHLEKILKKELNSKKYKTFKEVLSDLSKQICVNFSADKTEDMFLFPFDSYVTSSLIELVQNFNAQTGGLLKQKKINYEGQESLNNLWKETYLAKFLHSFDKNLSLVTQTSYLWLREYYLDITKNLEFPVEASLPWALLEISLKYQQAGDCALAGLEVYNDVTDSALGFFKKEYIYNEVRAEAALALEKLIFDYASNVFRYHKEIALELLLYKFTPLNNARNLALIDEVPLRARYNFELDSLLLKDFVFVAGESIPLKLTVQRNLNKQFRINLLLMLNAFQQHSAKQDLLEFYYNFEALKLAHHEICKKYELDLFEDIFAEIDGRVGSETSGRLLYTVQEGLLNNIICNFSYNSTTLRFVPSFKTKHLTSVDRKTAVRLRTARSTQFGRYTKHYLLLTKELCGFVGTETFDMLKTLLPSQQFRLLLEGLVKKLMKKTLEVNLLVQQILKGSPVIRMPSISYSLGELYGYFELLVRFLKEHTELCEEIFQRITEVGNLFALIKIVNNYLETDSLIKRETLRFFKSDDKSALVSAFGNLVSFSAADRAFLGKIQKVEEAVEVELESQNTFIRCCLDQTRQFLLTESVIQQWRVGAEDSMEYFTEMDKTKNICRFWSIVNFIFCSPIPGADFQRILNYGDGFFLCGAFFLSVSGMSSQFFHYDMTHFILTLTKEELLPSQVQRLESCSENGAEKEAALKLLQKLRAAKSHNFLFSSGTEDNKLKIKLNENCKKFVKNGFYAQNILVKELKYLEGLF